MTFPTFFNSSNGDVRVYDPSSHEGIEISQKMKEGDDVVKNIMRDNWNKIKKERGGFTDDD